MKNYEMFACARPQGARFAGESERNGATVYSIWRTEAHEFLRVQRAGADIGWYRLKEVQDAAA